jgi:hypothetical protein
MRPAPRDGKPHRCGQGMAPSPGTMKRSIGHTDGGGTRHALGAWVRASSDGTVSLLAGIDLVTGKVHALVKDRHHRSGLVVRSSVETA